MILSSLHNGRDHCSSAPLVPNRVVKEIQLIKKVNTIHNKGTKVELSLIFVRVRKSKQTRHGVRVVDSDEVAAPDTKAIEAF